MKKTLVGAIIALTLAATLAVTTPAFAHGSTKPTPVTGLNSATNAEKIALIANIRDNAIANAKSVYSASMDNARAVYETKVASGKMINGKLVVKDIAPALRARKAAEADAKRALNDAIKTAKATYAKEYASIRSSK